MPPPLLPPPPPPPPLTPLLPALLQPLLASSSAELDAQDPAWGYNQTTVGSRAHAAAHGAERAEFEARAPPPGPMAVAGEGESEAELRYERRWRRLLLLCTDPADAAAVCTSVHRLLEVSKSVVRRYVSKCAAYLPLAHHLLTHIA